MPLGKLEEELRDAEITDQREEINEFCEAVLKDNKGDNIRQAEIHRIIQDHIDWCQTNKQYAGIVAPWGHGKTEQVVIARTLDYLGKNQDNRIKIVCNSKDNAVKRVASIKRYIESDEDYHGIYPEVTPKISFTGKKFETWGKQELLIERKTPSKDLSVEAWGVFASGMGTRCDILIVDDPADYKNTILEPETRPKVADTIESGWMSRLEPDGFMIYIATIWHEEDATNHFMRNEGFSFLWMAITDDFRQIEIRLYNVDDTHPIVEKYGKQKKYFIDLWDEKWNEQALRDRLRKIGIRNFNRGYRQIPFSDEDRTFPHIVNCIIISEPLAPINWPHYGGMDLGGDKRPGTAIYTLAKSPAGIYHPVEIRYGKWDFTRATTELYSAYERYQHRAIFVENNALQSMVVTALKVAGKKPIPIRGYYTGKQKHDAEIGLPGLDVEFENRMWVIGQPPGHRIDCECGMCRWIRSMKQHPFSTETDTIMAGWFAHEAARKGRMMKAAATTPRQDWRQVFNA